MGREQIASNIVAVKTSPLYHAFQMYFFGGGGLSVQYFLNYLKYIFCSSNQFNNWKPLSPILYIFIIMCCYYTNVGKMIRFSYVIMVKRKHISS